MDEVSKKIIQAQGLLKGRTVSGRNIKSNIMHILSDIDFESTAFQCGLCKIVLDSEKFAAGCPNCGSTQSDSRE